MNDQFPVLVERRLKIRFPSSGEERDLLIQIGKPYNTGNEEDAACPVVMDGLFGRLADIHGVDAMDAIRLAIKLVEETLQEKSGELQVLWPNGEPYFDAKSQLRPLG
jgi:hypothetical protein